MAIREWLPYTDLKAEDIRDTLNANGGNVGNDLRSFFTEAANINKWAKYKPVIHPSMFIDDENRWKGKDGNCGVVAYEIDTSTVKSHLDASICDWTYQLPNGSVGQPFRLGDFRGYKAQFDVPPPICVSTLSWSVNIEDNKNVNFILDVWDSGEDPRILQLSDIDNFMDNQGVKVSASSMYFKCQVYKKGTNTLLKSGVATDPITDATYGRNIIFDGTTLGVPGYNETLYYDVYLYLGNVDDSFRLSIPPWNGDINVKYPLTLSVYHKAGEVWQTEMWIGYGLNGEWMVDTDMVADDNTPLYYLKINPRYDNGRAWFKVKVTNGGNTDLDMSITQFWLGWIGTVLDSNIIYATRMYSSNIGSYVNSVKLKPNGSDTLILYFDKAYFLDNQEDYSESNIPGDGETTLSAVIGYEGLTVASTLDYPVIFNREFMPGGGVGGAFEKA